MGFMASDRLISLVFSSSSLSQGFHGCTPGFRVLPGTALHSFIEGLYCGHETTF